MPLVDVEIELDEVGCASRVVLDGKDITDTLRGIEIRASAGEATTVRLTMLAKVSGTARSAIVVDATTLGQRLRGYLKGFFTGTLRGWIPR